tara:strand:- start:920 stop:5047 length:4128 start_codon:yes stop_codon:yes gene_type:complete
MAKKQEVVEVLLKLSDGNTIPVLAKKTKKAAKEMDNLGRASQATDRRIKGVTQQSSNSTKNFSKQAQTMQGGIVAAYATIAAQVFALSAAFQFLKNAVNMSNLIAGQENFAAITGTAYKTLTKDIQAATAGQIQFAEAAQAAAIGTAAGLSPKQLEELGRAAKNTSLALGRDLTDSFQRLVRGTTKAEPELLDELGIILRLEPALKAYAVANKKTVAQLTQFEKSQAIANEVLSQADSKFGQITDGIDDGAFALQQFVVAFDELMIELQKGLGAIAKVVLPFFTENVLALVGALGIILAPVLNSIFGEGMRNWAKNTKVTAKAASKASRQATDDAMYARQKFKESLGKGAPDYSRGKADLDAFGIKGKAQEGQLSQRQITAFKRSAQKRVGIAKNMNNRQLRDFKNMLKRQEIALKASTGRMQGMWTVMGTGFKAVTTSISSTWQLAMTKMAAATAWFAKQVNRAMRLMGWVGIALMIFEAGKALYEWIVGVDEAAEKEKKWLDSMTQKYTTLNEELDNMNKKLKTLNHNQSLIQTGNKLQSIDIASFIEDYNEAAKKAGPIEKELQTQFNATAKAIDEATGGRGDALRKAIRSGNVIKTEEIDINGVLHTQYSQSIQDILNLADVYIKGSQAAQKFAQTSRALSQALQGQIKGTKKLGFSDVRSVYSSYINEARARQKASQETLRTKFPMASFDADGNITGAINQILRDGGNVEAGKQVDSALFKRRVAKQSIYDIESTELPAAIAAGDTKKVEELNFLLTRMKQNYKDAQKVLEESNHPLAEALRVNENIHLVTHDAEAIQEKLNQYVKDELKLFKDKEDVQKRLVKGSFGSDAATKNALLGIKLEGEKLKIEDRRLAVKAAEFNLEVALLEGKEEDKENAREALRQAKNLYSLEFDQYELSTLKTEQQKFVNTLKETELTFSEKIEKVQRKIHQLQNSQKMAITDAIGHEQDRFQKLRQHLLDSTALFIAQEKKKQAEAAKTAYIQKFGVPGSGAYGQELVPTRDAQGNITGSVMQDRKTYAGDQGYLDSLERKIEKADNDVKRLESDLAIGGRSDILAKAIDFLDSASKARTTFDALYGTGITLNPGEQAYRQQLSSMGFGSDEEMRKGFEMEAKFAKIKDGKAFSDLNTQLADNLINTDEYNRLLDMLIEKQVLNNDEVEEYEGKWKSAKSAIAQAAVETRSLAIDTELMNGIQNTLSAGFTQMFQAMVDGSKSFKDSMKDLAKSVLADLAAMYLKAAALKMMMAFMPGGESVVNFLQGGRYGGEMTKYRGGGVAQGPESGYMAMLHGREAVVPLGNDRSIPVNLNGAGGSGNIVNVTVNMSGQGGSQTQVTGDGMQGLGRSIGNLVQQHLQQEMRPGGLLNSQGTKGRG